MWTTNDRAISELNAILHQLEPNSLHKIPQPVLAAIRKNATIHVDYIKPDIPLEKLKLEEETKEMLAVISYQYFCSSEEKKEWEQELSDNEQKYQEQLRKKYDTTHIFKSTQEDNFQNLEKKESTSLIEYNESFWKKIWNRIQKLMKKIRNGEK